jgi:group I intron endonuclease
MLGIYKITSPSGKVYIGQSTNIKKRWLHYTALDCADQPKLYNSLIKYGVSNHKFEVLEECEIDLLNEKERYWQELYNVIEKGLNCKLVQTNDRSGYHSKETRKKIGDANRGKPSSMKGRKHTEETKLKMSIAAKKSSYKRGKRFKGKKHSEETKNKISLANKGRPAVNRRAILQMDLKGNVIREWNSITEALKTTGITGIANVVTGKSKNSGGFIWKYKEDKV